MNPHPSSTLSRCVAISTLSVLALGRIVLADSVPLRKAGLWEIVTHPSNPKLHARTQRLCLDRDTDALLNRMGLGAGKSACGKLDIHSSGARVTIHAVCNFGPSTLSSDSVIVYSGDTSYRDEINGKFDPPMAGMSETHTVQEGKWVGACPAGMSPGDLLTSDGRGGEIRMNLRTMLGSGG